MQISLGHMPVELSPQKPQQNAKYKIHGTTSVRAAHSELWFFFVLASSPYDGMPAKLPRLLHDLVDIVSTNIEGDLWPGAGLTRYIVDDVWWEFPLILPSDWLLSWLISLARV